MIQLLTAAVVAISLPRVIDTVSGPYPTAIGVNPVTDRIYVANDGGGNSVSIIDGPTDRVLTLQDPLARGPLALAVDMRTDKIYVVNNRSGNVSVIDGLTNAVQE